MRKRGYYRTPSSSGWEKAVAIRGTWLPHKTGLDAIPDITPVVGKADDLGGVDL